MSGDILIRKEGRAGRITLNRPDALNALTYDMILRIDAILAEWRFEDDVNLVVIDAAGDRAFCSGGDIVDMYETGKAGDYSYGRRFWRDEYRMNAVIATYPKPVVSFLQGFTMGGGVGVGCHASHRVVCESSKIAMPEVSIGLIPDVGGTYLLGRAPGRLGEYLGLTATRMGPGDAILVGFADHFVPVEQWPEVIDALTSTGDVQRLTNAAHSAPQSPLEAQSETIRRYFQGETLGDIVSRLESETDEIAQNALKALNRNAPLATACALAMIRRARVEKDIHKALFQEFRYVWRAAEQGDFVEGIRAAIIDKDRSPKWAHDGPKAVQPADVSAMLKPLGEDDLKFETEEKP